MIGAADILEIVGHLQQAGLRVWLDGGWGVDALLGEETRPHDDLDCVVELADVTAAIAAMRDLGFVVVDDDYPTRVVVRDAADRRVDFHPVTFDDQGNGFQQLQDGTMAPYPRDGFFGRGEIAGIAVPCLTAALQVHHHLGYDPDDIDRHDVERICERFDIDLPEPYLR